MRVSYRNRTILISSPPQFPASLFFSINNSLKESPRLPPMIAPSYLSAEFPTREVCREINAAEPLQQRGATKRAHIERGISCDIRKLEQALSYYDVF